MSLTVSARPRFGPQVSSRQVPTPRYERGIDLADESLGGDDSEEFELAGTGAEVSTSSGTFETVVDYQAGRDTRGLLVEVAVSAESNGEFRVAANGRLWGPFSGATDFSLPGETARLFADSVVVSHRSTDGSSTTTRASIVAQEV